MYADINPVKSTLDVDFNLVVPLTTVIILYCSIESFLIWKPFPENERGILTIDVNEAHRSRSDISKLNQLTFLTASRLFRR